MGRKVLIIDLDVNAGSTKHFGIKPEAFLGTFEVMLGDEDALDVVVSKEDKANDALREGVNNLVDNVDIICGGRKLEQLEERLRMKKSKFDPAPPHDCLKSVVEQLRGHYDYVFLDTPPKCAASNYCCIQSC